MWERGDWISILTKSLLDVRARSNKGLIHKLFFSVRLAGGFLQNCPPPSLSKSSISFIFLAFNQNHTQDLYLHFPFSALHHLEFCKKDHKKSFGAKPGANTTHMIPACCAWERFYSNQKKKKKPVKRQFGISRRLKKNTLCFMNNPQKG